MPSRRSATSPSASAMRTILRFGDIVLGYDANRSTAVDATTKPFSGAPRPSLSAALWLSRHPIARRRRPTERPVSHSEAAGPGFRLGQPQWRVARADAAEHPRDGGSGGARRHAGDAVPGEEPDQ